jgi:Sulfotransferase family
MNADRRQTYKHPPRPEWVTRINAEGRVLGTGVVPLDSDSLLSTACANTGLNDFGDGDPDDHWRAHFEVLIAAIEKEAELNLLGRLLTRSDLLIYLQNRLEVTAWYKRHPEIAEEVIAQPVFIVGLPRSGTTILHEVLAQDKQFRFVKKWEALFPCPPPQENSYNSDSRIQRGHDLITIQNRISPEWKSMHDVGGELPVECIEFTTSCFLSEMFTASFQIPSYQDHLQAADVSEMYRWHRKMLKLLQWRFKRPHWLLKGCNHEPYIPKLLKTYPDAKIILTHRDPIKAVSSVVSVQGTIFGFRTDDPFSRNSYENWLRTDSVAAMLNQRIAWIEDGTLAPGQTANIRFADFSADPIPTLRRLYDEMGLALSSTTEQRMTDYLARKPKGVFGAHAYQTGDRSLTESERPLFERYQQYFHVPNE